MGRICDFLNEQLDLGLSIEMTRYGGAYGGGGAVYGCVEARLSDAELVERIRRLMIAVAEPFPISRSTAKSDF